MKNASIIALGLGTRLGLLLSAALCMGYILYTYVYQKDSEGWRAIRWQVLWLVSSSVLTILYTSIRDSFTWQQIASNAVYEAILILNKVWPRTLWFPVLGAMGGWTLRQGDVLLIAAYAALMTFSARTSDLASLVWGLPFLWGAVRLLRREGKEKRVLTGLLLLTALMHLVNAAINWMNVPYWGDFVKAGILGLCYPAVFAADVLGRFLAHRAAAPNAEHDADGSPAGMTDTAQAIAILAAEYGLTPREEEIIQYIYAGLTNREIAECTCTAEGTVKAHNYHIYSKMGITKRAQLTAAVNRVREGGQADFLRSAATAEKG